MEAGTRRRRRSAEDLEAMLGITSRLAACFDPATAFAEVAAAARQILKADRAVVWLYDAGRDDLVLDRGAGGSPVRVAAGMGPVGACASTRAPIKLPDVGADAGADPAVALASGNRPGCMLFLPLVDRRDVLVGVLHVIDGAVGTFDRVDEDVVTVLAEQCAVTLQRARAIEALLGGGRSPEDVEVARVVQASALPTAIPSMPGYDGVGVVLPAAQGGGTTFDLVPVDGRVAVMLGDAAGPGLACALALVRVQALLRVAFRLGADLATAIRLLNDRLAPTQAHDRRVTTIAGLLDPVRHRLEVHSAGQGAILHLSAAHGRCTRHAPTDLSPGAGPLAGPVPSVVTIDLAPGDIVLLLSDGVEAYRNATGEAFGEARVEAVARSHGARPMKALARRLLGALDGFASPAPRESRVALVLVARSPAVVRQRFDRRVDSLPRMAAFTARFFHEHAIERSLLAPVDFAVEELFTNMVKYSRPGGPQVEVALARIAGGIEVTLTDYEVDAFDVARAPDADVTLPIEQRRPGGLGLHLTRRLVDGLEYAYDEITREARVGFRKTVPPATERPG